MEYFLFISLFCSPTVQFYQNDEWATVSVKVKAKVDYPAHKIRYKFEEKYCAISIAGNIAWCTNGVINSIMST